MLLFTPENDLNTTIRPDHSPKPKEHFTGDDVIPTCPMKLSSTSHNSSRSFLCLKNSNVTLKVDLKKKQAKNLQIPKVSKTAQKQVRMTSTDLLLEL